VKILLAIVANKDLNQLWIRKDKISLGVRINIYNALVKPILLYNSGTWGLSKKEEDRLNAFHRQQLRYTLKMHHPRHISNANVYRICREISLSLVILKSRWRLFGHELRGGKDTPAFKSMKYYFLKSELSKYRRRPRMTLPTKLSGDLKLANKEISNFWL
jgi:hypothetical protein